MPGRLEIRLLGTAEVRVGGAALPAPLSVRSASLLGYLLVHRGTTVSRERVAAALWPESTDGQARTNLRHLLHTLRRSLPQLDEHLDTATATLRWREESAFELDVAAFEQLLCGEPPNPAGLRDAIALYRGDLLEGCEDAWLSEPRARLRRQLIGALADLAARYEADGQGLEAIRYAEHLLRLDPLAESTYRRLMRLHDAAQNRAQALRTYHLCSTTLERELGVEPSPATRAAYEALLPAARVPAPLAPTRASPPLVGRDRERGQLGSTWRAALAERAQLVLVSGDGGVGKTRLVEEFRAWCERRGAATAEARCYAAEGPLPYGAVAAWLRSDAIRPRLPGLDPVRLVELARLLPELLLEAGDLRPPEPLPEDEQRVRVFDAVTAALDLAPAPLVLVVDDLHHADRETCRLIHYLLRVRPRARLLLLATARGNELTDPSVHELLTALAARDRLVRLALGPLATTETAALLERLLGASLDPGAAQLVHEHTGGNPLFVVETVRAGWRPGSPKVPVSPRAQALLEARLAPLGAAARDLAVAGAVIGRAFDVELLSAVAWGRDHPGGAGDGPGEAARTDALVAGLDELWRHGVVGERGGEMSAGTYDFTHEILRNVALGLASPVRRALLHRRTARALEGRARGQGPRSAEIAGHHERAGDLERAAEWYRRAADAAQLLHAHTEAIRLLERALEVLDGVAPSPARDAQELELRTALLAPLVSEQGYASSAVATLQQRARVLAGSVGSPLSPPLLRSLAMTALTDDDFSAASDFARQLGRAGEADATGVLAVEADVLLGFAAFWQADFAAARTSLERAVARYRPEHARTHILAYGQDPSVVALARLGNTFWFLGDPVRARAARAAALARAEDIAHPYSRAAALLFAALLALDMGGEDADLRRYVSALAECAVDARPIRLTVTAFRGHLSVLDGASEAGVATIRRALQEARAGSAAPGLSAILSRVLLAACVAQGNAPAAVAAADAVLGAGTPGSVWAPEARRVRAALLASRS